MQCSKCYRDAIIFQPCSGQHLCVQHVAADVEAKAKKVIRAHRWLTCGDHIAVVLSGNRSSSALLYFLKQLTAERRDIRISAITIDEGIQSPGDPSRAKRIAELLDAECFAGSFQEDPGTEAGAVAQKTPDVSASPDCHTHRSLLLDRIARKHGITKIAMGFCLDDAAGAVLETVLRGDVERIISGTCSHCTIPRISPFISVPAEEVSMYAALHGFGHDCPPDPDRKDGLHTDLFALLDKYTKNHPATQYALLNLGELLAGSPSGSAGLVPAIEWWREPGPRICRNNSLCNEVSDGAH